MQENQKLELAAGLIHRAKELGADLAGFASVEQLKGAPSFTFTPEIQENTGNEKQSSGDTLEPGRVIWPERAKTVMVVALHHPEGKPDMDWWLGGIDPPGNKILAKIVDGLCKFASGRFGIRTFHFPYHVEKGGIYLKDAAVMAGLGCIGKNNLLITPRFGPRIRLRALSLDVELPPTGPIDFDPCKDCHAPCRRACPQHAFSRRIYANRGQLNPMLPGRDGDFSRTACYRQMKMDEEGAKDEEVKGFENPVKIIRYCRSCELLCPVGKS